MNTCFQVEICLKIRGSGRYLQAAAGKSLDEAMQRGVFYLFREDNIGHQTNPGFGATQGHCLGGGLYNGALVFGCVFFPSGVWRAHLLRSSSSGEPPADKVPGQFYAVQKACLELKRT